MKDPRLQACLVSDPAHVVPGDVGPHVSKIQLALLLLDVDRLPHSELLESRYASGTAQAVLAYKTRRNIVNRNYQTQADNIVGRMTIARMDADLVTLEDSAPRGVPGVLHSLPDTAPTYTLRRALLSTMGGRREPAVASFSDGGEEFRKILRNAGSRGGADTMVGPEPGMLRARICGAANGLAALAGKRFREPEVKACWGNTLKDGQNTLGTPPPPEPMTVHWCGIFATWVWAGALNVNWVFTHSDKGASNGPYKSGSRRRVMISRDPLFLAPGDIFVQAYGPFHHVLILKISADGKKADILEGNAGSGGAHETIVQMRSGYSLPSKPGDHYFYSVDSLREPPTNYGNDIPGKK